MNVSCFLYQDYLLIKTILKKDNSIRNDYSWILMIFSCSCKCNTFNNFLGHFGFIIGYFHWYRSHCSWCQNIIIGCRSISLLFFKSKRRKKTDFPYLYSEYITYNHKTNCCNSAEIFDGNSGIHVLTMPKIVYGSFLWNGCSPVMISIYHKWK